MRDEDGDAILAICDAITLHRAPTGRTACRAHRLPSAAGRTACASAPPAGRTARTARTAYRSLPTSGTPRDRMARLRLRSRRRLAH